MTETYRPPAVVEILPSPFDLMFGIDSIVEEGVVSDKRLNQVGFSVLYAAKYHKQGDIRQRAGDFIVQNSDFMYAYAFNLTKDDDSSRELVQQVFVKLYGLNDIPIGDYYVRYVQAALRHKYYDNRRKQRSDLVHQGLQHTTNQDSRYKFSDAVIDSKPDDQPSTLDLLVEGENSTEQARRLRDRMEQLPEKFQQVLNLHYVEGLPYEEIAEILELPIGTVKSRIHYAKQTLRRSLIANEHQS